MHSFLVPPLCFLPVVYIFLFVQTWMEWFCCNLIPIVQPLNFKAMFICTGKLLVELGIDCWESTRLWVSCTELQGLYWWVTYTDGYWVSAIHHKSFNSESCNASYWITILSHVIPHTVYRESCDTSYWITILSHVIPHAGLLHWVMQYLILDYYSESCNTWCWITIVNHVLIASYWITILSHV